MNTAIKSLFDSWLTVSTDEQPSLDLDTEYSIDEDPLAILLQVLGEDSSKWYEKTYLFSDVADKIKNKGSVNIEPFARDLSEKIKSYYRNKYFLNRFKDKEVSLFQQTVENIVSSSGKIKESELRPLFKLPYFYLEDMAVEDIIKDSVSVEGRVSRIEDDFSFITKVKRYGKSNDRYVRFILQNPKKQLLSIVITESNTSFPLWNYLYNEKANINFSGSVERGRFKGTDFGFYNIDNSAYNIRINKT